MGVSIVMGCDTLGQVTCKDYALILRLESLCAAQLVDTVSGVEWLENLRPYG